MRTIALRLTGTEASAEELEADGEEVEGMIKNVSKLRDVIMQATKVDSNNNKGIDILNDVGAYKSTYDILLEIAEIYDEIVEKDKQYGTKQANLLLETIAGKNRASIAASILQSPEMLKEAYAEATDAQGSAAIENEKYMNSVEGHLIKLKNAWEELWANASTREFVNGVIDLGTGILKIVNNLGLVKTALLAIAGLDIVKWLIIGSTGYGKNNSLFGGLVNSLLQFNTKGGIKGLLTGGLEGATETAIKGAGEVTSEVTSTEVLEGALSEAAGDSVVKGAEEGIFKGLASSGIGKIVTNIGTSISSLLPIVGYLALIAGAIGTIYIVFKGISNAIDKANLSLKETREEAKTLVSDYQTSQKNSNANKARAEELSGRYEELSRGVNLANNQNLTLTNEEYSEYLSICNDIANMYPRLVSGYDTQGNAILKLKGNVEQLTEAYKQEQITAARTLIQGGENGEDARSIWDDFQHYKTLERPIQNKDKEIFDSILSSPDAKAEVNRILTENRYDRVEFAKKTHTPEELAKASEYDTLIEYGFSVDMDDASFNETMNKFKALVDEAEASSEEVSQRMRTMAQSFAIANDSYWDLNETQQGFVTSAINNMDRETLLGFEDYESYYNYINDLVELANNALNSNESVFDEQWQNILNQDNLDYVIDDYENSLNELEKLGYKQQDVIDLINQDEVKVGGVNLSTDRTIDWGEDPTKNKNFKNLQTWYDKSEEELAEYFRDTTSTVLGRSDDFDIGNGEQITLSFATVTEDGEVLDKDTVMDYIRGIIDKANENDEAITIDTILKYDSKENGGRNLIAGAGDEAGEAMHEIEVLKGFGNIEGAYKTLDDLAQKTGKSIDDFITEYYKLGNLKDINTFRDVYADMLNLGSGKGNLANAKTMKEFQDIAGFYRQVFVDQFKEEIGEDASIDLFNSIFDDQGRGDLTKGFSDILQQKWLLDPNSFGYQKYMEQFENYSYDEAKAYANAFSKIDSLSDAEIQQEFSKGLRDTAAGAYQATLNIEEETAAINSLNSAIASSNGVTGLSSEEVTNVEALYKDLAGYDASELFESTANGIHLNQKELRKLNKEYQKSKVKQQSKQYDELQKQLSDSKEALKGLKAQYEQGDTSILDEINAENRRKEGIEENINALEREMAQYSALTSAYNQYVNAQSSANENAKYENIQTGYDTAKDLIKRGWGGQDDVRAYVNMFTKEDMMTAPVDKVIAKFNELDDKVANTSYSMKDFFTVDDNGKSTSEGIFNFLDVVKAKAKQEMPELGDAILDQLVSVDEAGIYSFDFDILGGDQKVADMLGVDLSLLQAIIQAAQDAGFEVQMTDALPGLQGLTQEMVNMRAELIRLGGDAEKFDFNVLSVDVEGKDGKTPEFDNKVKEIQETIETLKNSDLNDPQTFAALNYANSQLDVLIEKRARFLADSQMGDMGVDLSTVSEKYQQVGVLLDDFLLKQNRLNEASRLGLDTSDFESELNSAQQDFYNTLATFSSDELNEIGLHFTADFDELTPEEKAEQIKQQFEEEEVTLHLNTETDTPQDPTKGMDGQHVVIEVQFTMNGETVAIEAINTVTEAAEGVPNETNTTMNVDSEEAEAEANEYGEVLGEATKDRDTRFITNSDGEKKRVKSYISSLDAIPPSVRSNVTVSGLSSATTGAKDLAKNLANLSGKTIKTYIQQITEKKTIYTGSRAGMPSNIPRYNGTAHAYGTITKFSRNNAYANGRYSGNWGVPQDEDALINELGEELIIHDGKWRIANNGNMGFTHLEKGDIVLNHEQTEELLKKGYVSNSRGVLVGGFSHAMGTTGDAFSLGTGAGRTTKKTTTNKANKSSGNKKSGGGNNNSNKKSSNNNNNNNNTAETFDWVEVKIQRIEEAIAQLDSIIDSVYNTWDTRNNNLNKDLIKVGEEIDLQKRAIETYNNYLNKIGLSQTYINKIKKGELRIEDIKDDKLKEKIQKYQEYYNKVVQCQTSITELKEREKELVAQRFDNYQTWYEERLQDLDFRIEMMETLSDRAEKSGRLMSGYYAGIMRDTEEARINVLKREYNQLVTELEQATNSNTIAKWSEQWYEMCDSIDEVSQAIAEAENNVIEYQNTIREYEWERFDKTLDRIGQIADETEWLNELLEEGKSFEEETGEYTKLGSARMGTLAIQYDTYLNESARYAAELKNIEKDIAKDPYNQDLLDRRNELLEAQRDAISNALKERDAIKSLVEEGIEAQLNALQKLIDKYKEALQSQKDLYDYQNNVTESADEISRLQKLISAYQGDDSEESRLKVQQYQKELKDAQKSLYDTQYDRNISDTEEALDKLYEQYEETLNNALDDVDKLIADVIKGVNSGSQDIVQTIKEAADKYGYTLTDSMSTIVSSINKLVSEDIKKNISSSDTGHNNTPKSGVDTASNNISQNVNSAVQDSFNKAKEEYEKGKATSIIRKNFLSDDRKSYTDAEGRTIQFTRAVAKGKDDFVNDTKGNQYYFDEGGNLVGYGGGLQTIHGYKYFTDGKDNKGALQTGWQQVGDKWYYFYKSTMKQYKDHYKGVAATGWQDIDGETYYFDKSGVMQTGRWKDRKIGDKKYYRYWLKDNGKAFKNTSAKMGKTTYYFDKNGYLLDKKGGKPKVFTSAQYKTGVYGLTQDQLAWTQENKKEEAIIRPSDGAILTPLSHGDSVLNAKATKALFEFANNPDEYFKSYTDGSNYNDIPTINNTMNGNMNIQFNINGANITDYDTFKKQLTSDPQFERLLRSMTTDRLFGGSSLKKYKI